MERRRCYGHVFSDCVLHIPCVVVYVSERRMPARPKPQLERLRHHQQRHSRETRGVGIGERRTSSIGSAKALFVLHAEFGRDTYQSVHMRSLRTT